MPITSSVPVLLGDQGTELRSDDAGLLIRRPHEEVRIPLAAVAHVHANGRVVAVELTAPAGTEPTRYRIEGVSRASGTAFEEAVNGSLPERPADEDPVDGSTLVTVTPRAGARAGREEDDEQDAEPLQPAELVIRCTMAAVGLGLVALSAGVVVAGDHVSRALAVLLLGGTGLAIGRAAVRTVAILWNKWYLPRHGITIEAQPVLIHGRVNYGYTATDGRLRPALTPDGVRGEAYHVAYHPKYPARVVACQSLGAVFKWLPVPVVFTALTVLFGWSAVALALPAFR
ncbi:hypothetical protein ACFZAG_38795 [Streptomyces sp. NPDC012403]|uniref:hypothetical protein n=1 Tax=Streptomyces sp. NPDC012403 TaxID=3364831 RepID=UPI0036EC8560